MHILFLIEYTISSVLCSSSFSLSSVELGQIMSTYYQQQILLATQHLHINCYCMLETCLSVVRSFRRLLRDCRKKDCSMMLQQVIKAILENFVPLSSSSFSACMPSQYEKERKSKVCPKYDKCPKVKKKKKNRRKRRIEEEKEQKKKKKKKNRKRRKSQLKRPKLEESSLVVKQCKSLGTTLGLNPIRSVQLNSK